MNKKITLVIGGLTALALLFFAGVSTANGAVMTVSGDRFDPSVGFYIYSYDGDVLGGGGNPCSGGILEGGKNLIGTAGLVAGVPDTDKNNDAGWSITINPASATTRLYLCTGGGALGDLRAEYGPKDYSAGGTDVVDLTRVSGSALNANLNTKTVVLCDELDGTHMKSKAPTVNAETYEVFMFKADDELTGTDYYVLITNADSCTFNNNVLAAQKITVTSSTYGYGVHHSFSPSVQFTGDAHQNLAANNKLSFQDTVKNIGIVEILAGDGLDNANNDYTTYISAPTGTMTMTLEKTGITTQTLSSVPGATTSFDFLVHVSGNTASDINYVSFDDGNGATTWTQTTTPSGGSYDLYVQDDTGNAYIEAITMKTGGSGGTTVITIDNTAPRINDDDTCTPGNIGGEANFFVIKDVDTVAGESDWDGTDAAGECPNVDVFKLSGGLDLTFETAGTEEIDVINDYLLAAALGGGGFVTYNTVDPTATPTGNAANEDYKTYFALHYTDDGNPATLPNTDVEYDVRGVSAEAGVSYVFYLNGRITGMTRELGGSKDLDLLNKLSGGTPDAAADAVVIRDQADYGGGTTSAVAITVADGTYELFVDTVLGGDTYNYHSLAAPAVLANGNRELARGPGSGANFNADATFNVAKVTGDTHTDLNDGDAANDRIAVYSEATCAATLVSSETEQPLVANPIDYTQYYEPTGGATTYYIRASVAAGESATWSCVKFAGSGAGATDNSIDILYSLSGTIPNAADSVGKEVLSVWTDIDGTPDGVWDAFTSPASTAGTYTMYTRAGDATSKIGFNDAASAGGNVLLYTDGALNANETRSVAFVSGTLDTTYVTADASGTIALDAAGSVGVTIAWAASPTYISSHYYVTNNTDGGLDEFVAYFDTETTVGASDVDVRFKDAASYVSWNMDVNGGNVAAGTKITKANVIKVSGDTPDYADSHIFIVDDDALNTVLAAGLVSTVDGTYAIYTIAHNPGAVPGDYIYGKFQKPRGTDASLNIKYTQWLTADTVPLADKTWNLVEMTGTIPTEVNTLDGASYAEVRDDTATACNAALADGEYRLAWTDDGASSDYEIFYEAAQTRYLQFCTAGHVKHYITGDKAIATAGQTKNLHLAAIKGQMDAGFVEGAAAKIDVYDNYNATPVGTNNNTDLDEAAILVTEAGIDYVVYFEQSGDGALLDPLTDEQAPAGRTEADVVADVAMKITDNGALVFWEIGLENAGVAPAAGVVIVVNLAEDISGTVPVGVDLVVIQDANNEYALAIPNVGTGVYAIVTQARGAVNFVVEEPSGTEVLLMAQAEQGDPDTFDANKITVTTHADLRDDTQDLIQVYTTDAGTSDANCGGTLLSSLAVGPMGAAQEVYFEKTGANDLVVNLKLNSRETNDYVSCVNTETQQAAAGSAIAYSANQLVSGNVGSSITHVYIDNDNNSVTWEVDATVTDLTPDAYKAYYAGATPSASSAGGTELIRTGKVWAAGGTFNVGKVSGNSNATLDTVVVYSGNDCTTNISSQPEDPADTYIQYFEGVDGGGPYYMAVDDATYNPTCFNTGFVLTSQEYTTNFNRKLSGTVPDQDETDTDMLSVAADTGAKTYWTNTVNGGGTNTYAAYVDSTDTSITATAVVFKNTAGGAGTALLTVTKDLTGDAAVDAGVVYGETHADIEAGSNRINAVCVAPQTSNATCTTKYSTVPVTAADNAAGLGHDYDIFYEWPSNTTLYLEILDDDAVSYYSWNQFTSGTAGTDVNVELDGKLSGYVAEAWDTPTTRVPDVLVQMYDDARVAEISRAYTYTGTTTPGGNYRMYGNLTTDVDGKYSKAAYITQWNEAGALSQTVNIDLVSGIKITVKYSADEQLVETATVSLYVCSDATTCARTTLDTCTHPNNDCSIVGDNTVGDGLIGEYYFTGMTVGTYVQVKLEKTGFDTVWSPDPAALGVTDTAYQVSDTAQISLNLYLINPAPSSPTLVTPANGFATTDTTPDLTWVDLGGDETYYEVQIDDSANFGSLHAGGGNTANGATVTWTVDAALTDNTLYYWRVRGCDAGNCGDWSESRYLFVNTGWNTIAAPTVANTAGTSQVRITWTAVTGAESYAIYRNAASPVAALDANRIATTDKINYTDTVADGGYYYAITAIDEPGNESTVSTTSALVTVDTAAPTENSIIINGGVDYTNNATLNLALNANTAATMNFSCDGDTWTGWVAYAAASTLDLTAGTGGCAAGDGNKIVYFKTRDANLNETPTVYDEIILDRTLPTITASGPAALQNSRTVLLTATSSENAECRYSTVAATAYAAMTDVMSGALTIHEAMVLIPTATAYNGATNNYYVRCQDTAGNPMVADTTITFTVDAIAPTITDVTPVYSATPYRAGNVGTIQIKTDIAANCRWDTQDASYATLSNGPIAVAADTFTILTGAAAATAEGLNHFYVRCQSTAATPTTMNSSGLIAFNYDSVAPTYQLVSVTSNGNGQTVAGVLYANNGDTITVRLQASEAINAVPTVQIGGANGAMACTLNGTLITCTHAIGNETLTAIITADGATDLAGNGDTAFDDAGVNAEFDFTVPVLTVPLPATTQTTRSFTASINGGEANLSCRASTDVDANTYDEMGMNLAYVAPNIYGETITVGADGNYTVYFACRDYAGNETTANTVAFAVDTTAPSENSIVINAGSDYTNNATLALTLNANGVNQMSFSCNSTTWIAWEAYAATRNLNLGTVGGGCTAGDATKIVYFKTRDVNNNEAPAVYDEIVLDVTAPGTVTAVNDPGAVDEDGVVTWTWTAAADATSGIKDYEVKIATGSADCSANVILTSYTSEVSYTHSGLTDGSNYYACVKARDNATNLGAAINSDGILIDTLVPDQVVLNTPLDRGYWTTDLRPTLGWTDVAGEDTYQLQISQDFNFSAGFDVDNAAVPAGGTTGAQVTYTLAAGEALVSGTLYYWRVRALDANATDGMWSEVRSFTVDNVAPVITVTEPGNQNTRSFQVTVTAAGAEAGLTCKMSTSNVVYAAMEEFLADIGAGTYRGSMSVVPADGNYDIYARCRDAASNEGNDATNAAFAVQSVAPAVTNSTPPEVVYNAATLAAAGGITITTDVVANCVWDTNDASYANMPAGNQFATLANTATALAGAAATDGLNVFYIRCRTTTTAVEMSSSAVIIFTYDNTAPTYTFLYSISSADVMNGSTVSVLYQVSEDLTVAPTATVGAQAGTVTLIAGRVVQVSRILNGTETNNNIVITGGADAAGNVSAGLNDNNRFVRDFAAPVLATPTPANASIQTNRILGLDINGGEVGLDCRAHTATTAATADIPFASMDIFLADDQDNTYSATLAYGSDGVKFVNIKCHDVAGNEGEFGNVGTPYSFTINVSPNPTQPLITGIAATETYAIAGGGWPDWNDATIDGWSWTFSVSVPVAETSLQMLLDNWVGTGGATIAAVNNIRFYSAQSTNHNNVATAIVVDVAGNWTTTVMTLNPALDLNAGQGGTQIEIKVEAQVPAGATAGSYSTRYGIWTY